MSKQAFMGRPRIFYRDPFHQEFDSLSKNWRSHESHVQEGDFCSPSTDGG